MERKRLDFTPQVSKKNLLVSSADVNEERKRQLIRKREREAESQRLRELQDSNFRWVWCSLLSGLTCGLGNYVLGIKLAHTGVMGPGFTGPLTLAILLIYRVIQFII